MLKKSNSILFKAFAMGTLLANGGMAMDGDDDKRGKKLDTPLYNSGSYKTPTEAVSKIGNRDFHRSLVEPPVRHILTQADERAEMRRELIRAPKIIDLRGASIRGVSPFHKVIHTLLADARTYGASIDKLTLLNATEEELAEILGHEDVQYVKEFDWTTYTPHHLIDDMEAYDFMEEDNKWSTDFFETSTDDLEEEWIDDPWELTTTDDSDEEWIVDPWRLIDVDDSDDEEWMNDPHHIRDIGNLDEEWIDLENVMGVDHLDEAQIGGLRNVRNGNDLDDERVEGLRNIMDVGNPEERNVRNEDDLDDGWVDDFLLMVMGDEPNEGLIDDSLLEVEGNLNKEWIKDPTGLKRKGLYEKLPLLRKAVARARHAPSLSELLQDLEQEAIAVPPEENVDGNEPLLIKDELFEPSAWNMTLLKDIKENADPNSQNVGQLNSLASHKSHNLVHIFCRQSAAQA